MKKIMTSLFGIIATGLLLITFSSSAVAQEKQVARCTLTYTIGNMLSVNAEGPCTFFQVGDIVNIQGVVEENGQKYIATIDNAKNEGLLIGGGTFTLAHGKLAKNDPTEVVWPNGYVLKIILK